MSLIEREKLIELAYSRIDGIDRLYGQTTPDANKAKDAIVALLSENEKLKVERDAAIAEIVKMCPNCKHASCDWFSKECKDCNHKEKWEWRGVKEDTDA